MVYVPGKTDLLAPGHQTRILLRHHTQMAGGQKQRKKERKEERERPWKGRNKQTDM